jgi:hypothetical protein
MLTFGWAFSFLGGLGEAQSGLGAFRRRFFSPGIRGRFPAALSARNRERDRLQPNGQIWSTKRVLRTSAETRRFS